jgi:hypothetical protein
LAPALVGRITRHVINLGASSVEFSWIAQSNPLSFETIENGGAVRSKTMRIYQADCVDLLERLAGNAGSVLERPSPAENSSSQSAWANPPTVSVSD